MHYRLLQIDKNGSHKLHEVAISSALTRGTSYPFTDEDIECSNTECIIQIARSNNGPVRLIVTPYLSSSFKVLEILTDAENQPLVQSTYQLDSAKNGSAVRNFQKTYDNSTIQAFTQLNSKSEITGLWVGRLVMDDKPQLLSFAVSPDAQSNFTLHINGDKIVNRTTFMADDIVEQDDLITINTTHPTFANQLIINRLSSSQIRGYMYSAHKGQTLQTGEFWLMRIE